MLFKNWLISVYFRLNRVRFRHLGRRKREQSQGQRPLMIERLESRQLLSGAPVPVGSETHVNTNTTGNPQGSVVATDAAGDYVIAWPSLQDGSSYGIYAQRYNAAGVAQGGEFLVNTYTTGGQTRPAVAMDATGDFVIAWSSYGQDGSGPGVYAQRFDSAGTALGGEFQVNSYTSLFQTDPSVAMDQVGDFIITWESLFQDGSQGGVYAQLYNSAGVRISNEFRVSTSTLQSQTSPQAAMDATGDFVITWSGYGQGGFKYDIYAQRYDSAGTPQGTEFMVNTLTTGAQINPSIAMDPTGDFVITWLSPLVYGMPYDIFARRFNSAGVAQGDGFLVNTQTAAPHHPWVGMDSAGDFVITWASYQDGSFGSVDAQVYNSGGTAQGGEFVVNSFTTSYEDQPSVAMDLAGDFVVSWTRFTNNAPFSPYGIYSQRFQGNLTATPIVILPTKANVGATTATLGGKVILPDGAASITARGVVYALTSDNTNPRLGGTGVTNVTVAGTTGVFTTDISGLTPGSTYSFVAYATNSAGTTYTSPVSTLTLGANHAPVGTSGTVATLEDTAYVFTTTDFGFTDPDDTPANSLLAVKITALPSKGTLKDNGTAVTAGQFVSVADISGHKLIFTPPANAKGTSFDSISFQVQDDGGTANGGVDVDPVAKSLTVDVFSVNNPPVGTSKVVTTLEDTAYTFSTTDFGFKDPNDTPANSFLALKITTLPSKGTLSDNGTAVTAGQFVSVADITGNKLIFAPSANGNGTAYTTFTFQVQDDGGTVDGGIDTDPTPKTLLVNVTSVNDAPAGTSGTVTTLGDTAYTFKTADFGFTDPNDSAANSLLDVKFTLLPTAGIIKDNGTAISVNQTVSAADISGGSLTFTPNAGLSDGSYFLAKFQVQDDGGTSNGGTDTDPTEKTLTVNVTDVNDAPVGTLGTVTTLEDTAYPFKTADFGFTDPNDTPANALLAVKITTLPSKGTLSDNGTAVTAGQFVSVADLAGKKLVFTPPANDKGTAYTSFTFQVQDDGGTSDGGIDTDPTPKKLSVNVTSVNDAPTGTTATLTSNEDAVYKFKTADFGFTDPNDSPANSLLAVKFTLLPSVGTIKDNGTAISANQFVPASDITGGFLTFTPNANLNGTYFLSKFQVQDNGGTANGGKDLDPTAKSLYVKLNSVNDAPIGTTATLTSNEDAVYKFKTADFGFTDPNDSPANKLLAVKFTLLPSAGTIKDNGVAISLNQFVTAADISGGLLTFTPNANLSGTYFLSKFQVQDNGGTANGGKDLDPTAKSLSVKLNGVNDAPIGTTATLTSNEDAVYKIKTTDFGFTDPHDVPANSLLAVKFTMLPNAGTIKDKGVSISANQFVTAADIANGLLTFTPNANLNGTFFLCKFQVQDNGGTTSGGKDLDPTPKQLSIKLISVNDAPVGTSKTVSMIQNTTLTLKISDFGFTDPNDSPANALFAVKITALPSLGTLTDNGVAVTVGQTISAADISSGKLKYTPPANASGSALASIGFKVQDTGGTANGGLDTDLTQRMLTISVS